MACLEDFKTTRATNEWRGRERSRIGRRGSRPKRYWAELLGDGMDAEQRLS